MCVIVIVEMLVGDRAVLYMHWYYMCWLLGAVKLAQLIKVCITSAECCSSKCSWYYYRV